MLSASLMSVISVTMMDGMASRSVDIVGRKAYTESLMGRRAADWWEQMKKLGIDRHAMGDSKMTYLSGGTSVFTADGDLIGAIGISGWKMEEDQMLADEAVEHLYSVQRKDCVKCKEKMIG